MTGGGETKEITFHQGFAFGENSGKRIKVFDLPGLLDPEMPM
jgi:hypothetical protein